MERRREWLARLGWMPILIAAKYLILDTIFFRMDFGAAPATVLLNLQALAGLVVIGALATVWYLAHEAGQVEYRKVASFLCVLVLLCIAAGFKFRSAAVRYFGLGLFALTLLKVVFVDLANAGQGYRVLSFMGLGLLLLGTSVLYGKLSPKLLAEPRLTEGQGLGATMENPGPAGRGY